MRTRGRRRADDVQFGTAPMGGHLASTGSGVGLGANSLQQHVARRPAHREGTGTVTVIGEKPVVTGTEDHPGGGLNGFVSGGRNLEVDLLLPFHEDLAVV